MSLYSNDRGPKFLNYFDNYRGDKLNLGGGFSYVKMFTEQGSEVFSSSFLYANNETRSSFTRHFGIGYFSVLMHFNCLSINHTLFAPYGDDPVLIDQVTLSNQCDESIAFEHYEYFDVNQWCIACAVLTCMRVLSSTGR